MNCFQLQGDEHVDFYKRTLNKSLLKGTFTNQLQPCITPQASDRL